MSNTKKRKTKVLLVIPVFDEEKILEKNVIRIYNYLNNNLKFPFEIVIADNDSHDRTAEIGKRISKRNRKIYYLFIPEKGRGGALKRAWNSYNANIFCYMDADLSTHLRHFPKLIDEIKNGYDIVTGSRFLKNSKVERSLKREILSRAYNLVIRFMFKTKVGDMQCGFKAVNHRVIREILPLVEDKHWFFDAEMILLAEMKDFKIKEIPVEWMERVPSRASITKDVGSLVSSMLRLYIRIRRGLIKSKT